MNLPPNYRLGYDTKQCTNEFFLILGKGEISTCVGPESRVVL
jgi:hypothetical protein